MTSLEETEGSVTFLIGDCSGPSGSREYSKCSRISIPARVLTSGALRDTFLSTIYLTPLGTRENKNEIRIEDDLGVDGAYYVAIIAKFASTGSRSDIPWNDPKFDISKLCDLADKWSITPLMDVLGCKYLSKKTNKDDIKYILKQMPNVFLNEIRSLVIHGRVYSVQSRDVKIKDNQVEFSLLFSVPDFNISKTITVLGSDLFAREVGLFSVSENILGAKIKEIADGLKQDKDVLNASATKYSSYEHAVFMLNILTNFTTDQIMEVVRVNGGWGSPGSIFEEATANTEKIFALLNTLEAKHKPAETKQESKATQLEPSLHQPVATSPVYGYAGAGGFQLQPQANFQLPVGPVGLGAYAGGI